MIARLALLGAFNLFRAALSLGATCLLRAGAIFIRAGSTGSAAVFFIAARLPGAALGLGAFGLLRAACLFFGTFNLLGTALLHTGDRRSGSRSGILSLGKAERESNGKQCESKLLHDIGSFYWFGILVV